MSNSNNVNPVAKKKKLSQKMLLIIPNDSHKYTTSYIYSLYYLRIIDKDRFSIIPSVLDYNKIVYCDNKISKLVLAFSNYNNMILGAESFQSRNHMVTII